MTDISYLCRNKSNLFLAVGPLLAGAFVFFVLVVLLVPLRINIPVSILISFLIFWLARYYFANKQDYIKDRCDKAGLTDSGEKSSTNKGIYSVIYAILFSISLSISFFTAYDPDIYVSWINFTLIDGLKLISSMGLTLFMPGYALISVICKHEELRTIYKYFLAYLISVLITGLFAYVMGSSGLSVLESKNFILAMYVVMLALYVVKRWDKINKVNLSKFSYSRELGVAIRYLSKNMPVVMVFISLFMFEITLTYYIFNGTMIGDQWFHHGRALQFVNGAYKDIEISAPHYYPPLFASVISVFLVLSGIPSVNAFVSINFLIMPPIMIFYFFVRAWLPPLIKKSALISVTLFTLASGFGWTYVIGLAMSEPVSSQTAALEILRVATLKSFDLNLANTFFATPHPSPHGSIALPAGFLLLILLKLNLTSKLKYAFSFLVSTVGILSHDEFYFFILISCSLVLLYRISKGHLIFMSLLSSIAFVHIVDFLLPVKYFTAIEISGMPLMYLSFGFVLATWILYSFNVAYIIRNKLNRKIRIRKINIVAFKGNNRFFVITVIVSAILYLYLFTFIVWSDLSVEQVAIQTDNYGQRDIPWYLIPMKLGIAGLFGTLCILSYFYKKFQKEIFVFALIAIFAFLAAPYYDEYRFGKFIMVGMIGFASVILYSIICYLRTLRLNSLLVGIFISVIVTASVLSLLMYSGFKAILIDNPGYRLIAGENNRFFPDKSEMKFLTTLKNKIVDIRTDNIAFFSKEYGNGLLSEKIMGFVGIPYQKIYHNRLILNATTLPSLIELLDQSDIRYIIVDPRDLESISEDNRPILFAVNNFPRIYDDDGHIVLRVPKLIKPNSNPNIALVYEPTDLTPSRGFRNLEFNISSSGLDSGFRTGTNGSIILSNNGTNPTAVWTNLGRDKINLIETQFRITKENRPIKISEVPWNKDTSYFEQFGYSQYPGNNLGIRWSDNATDYTLLLDAKGLKLSTKSVKGSDNSSITYNHEILKESWKWYRIKILLLEKEIVVFINDIPRMHVPREGNDNTEKVISNLGVVVHGNDVEFLPIQTKQISNIDQDYYRYLENTNYIISSLAMSGANYGIFLAPDLSTNPKMIILPADPENMTLDYFQRYLQYVMNGKTLVIFNSKDSIGGTFSNYLSLNSTNFFSEFNNLRFVHENPQEKVMANGKARVVKIPTDNKTKATSFYSDDLNHSLTPFTIEKEFPNGGKIIYVNNFGFFESISKTRSNLLELTKVADMLSINYNGNPGIRFDDVKSLHNFTNLEKFIGLMEMHGKTSVISSSLIPYGEKMHPADLNLRTNKLIISNDQKKMNFENVTIKALRFYGQYSVQINFSGFISLPSSNSFYDYIDFHTPADSSIRINAVVANGGGAEVSLKNESKVNTYNFTDNFEIDIVQNDIHSLNFLIKEPEIRFIGNATIDSPDFTNYSLSGNRFFKVHGTLSTTFDHVDDYRARNDNSVESRYVSYLKGLNITGETYPGDEKVRVMGDISYRARNHDVGIPLQQIFMSTQNIILLFSVIGACFLISKLVWSKITL